MATGDTYSEEVRDLGHSNGDTTTGDLDQARQTEVSAEEISDSIILLVKGVSGLKSRRHGREPRGGGWASEGIFLSVRIEKRTDSRGARRSANEVVGEVDSTTLTLDIGGSSILGGVHGDAGVLRRVNWTIVQGRRECLAEGGITAMSHAALIRGGRYEM